MFSLPCVASIAIGLVFGYIFSWSVRSTKPSIAEIGSLIATLLGGTVASTIGQLQCDNSLTFYLLGLAAGFFLYILMVIFNWNHLPKNACGGTTPPLFPFHHISSCRGQAVDKSSGNTSCPSCDGKSPR
ncbi:MAG: hypothetical protein K8F91_17400 [Candidatus Obscuribacterales bacterium]|nr:hypothetical protein [Candidatus Obscuribacterales bacterium]